MWLACEKLLASTVISGCFLQLISWYLLLELRCLFIQLGVMKNFQWNFLVLILSSSWLSSLLLQRLQHWEVFHWCGYLPYALSVTLSNHRMQYYDQLMLLIHLTICYIAEYAKIVIGKTSNTSHVEPWKLWPESHLKIVLMGHKCNGRIPG